MQPFELGRDFAKRQVRVRRMDTGDQRHQPILGQPGRGFAKQCRIGHPLRDHPFHGAAKTLRRPVEVALVQYAGDVVPGVILAACAERSEAIDWPLPVRVLRKLLFVPRSS